MTMTMKIDADKKEEKESTSTAQPKKTSEKTNESEMPEEKIAELCKKEKLTAKDAGHFLFYVLAGCYGYPIKEQRMPATDAQWVFFNSQHNRLMESENSAAEMETYMDLYRYFLVMRQLFNVQKECLIHGAESCFYLISFPRENEEGECAVEKEMRKHEIHLNEDIFDSFSDTYAIYKEKSGPSFKETIDLRVDTGWRWITAWNTFTKLIGRLYALDGECFNLCPDLTDTMGLIDKANSCIKYLSDPKNLSSHGEQEGVTREIKARYIKENYPVYDYKANLPTKDRVAHVTEILKKEKAAHSCRISDIGQYCIVFLAGSADHVEEVDE